MGFPERISEECLKPFTVGTKNRLFVAIPMGPVAVPEKYRDAAILGSPREYASVLDQIDFLIAMGGAKKQVAKNLSALRRKARRCNRQKGQKERLKIYFYRRHTQTNADGSRKTN